MRVFALVLIGLLVVDGANLPCPTCSNATGGAVCAKATDGTTKQFASLCEMNRLNCVNNRLDYSVSTNGQCATSAPAVAKCGNCSGTATSAVCGKDSQGKLVTFVNSCWLQLNNCNLPNKVFTFVNKGYCAPPVASTPAKNKAPVVDGVSSHPRIGLINSAECGKIPTGNKIFNGQDAGLYQYPWTVYLTIYDQATDSGAACGGSIISPRYVLTAAHCASDFDPPAMTITAVLGEYTLSTDVDCAAVGGRRTCGGWTQEVDVEKVIVHPSYKDAGDGNDIALLRLAEGIDFSTIAMKPVCLPVGTREETRLFDGEMLTVVGWGLIGKDKEADTLQMVTVPGVEASRCEKMYADGTIIHDGQLCAGKSNVKDSCDGDSGGPIMYTNLAGTRMNQYGLVSYGAACGEDKIPGVYTRVGFYMKWILDNIRP